MKISILFLLSMAFILMASVQDCDGYSPRIAKPSTDDLKESDASDAIPLFRGPRSILAEQPELIEDIIKDIDFYQPMFQGQPPNQFYPQPQYYPQNQQPMFPQQPQYPPQQFPSQQPQNQQQRLIFHPNFQMNTQQRAMAKQIAAAAVQFAQQMFSSFLQLKRPNNNWMNNNFPVTDSIGAPTTEASLPESGAEPPAGYPEQSA